MTQEETALRRETLCTTSITDLSRLQDEILGLEDKHDRLKKELDALNADLGGKKAQMIEYMNAAKLTNFKTPRGQIILNRKFAVTVPKGEDLDNFFTFLEASAPDHYRALRTVNYQTLNSWYMAELDMAKMRGEFGWCPPGLKEPKVGEYLSIRKL